MNAFDQLTKLAQSRRYRETAQALGAVKQLSHFFKSFVNVDRVAAVSRGVVEVQGVLRAQVLKEFEDACVVLSRLPNLAHLQNRRFATDTSKVGKTALLTDACLVVDGLGDDAKCVHSPLRSDSTRADPMSIEQLSSPGIRRSCCVTIDVYSARRRKPVNSTTSPVDSHGFGEFFKLTKSKTPSCFPVIGTLALC